MKSKLDSYSILLDNQSQINIFHSHHLVKNIRKTPFPVKVTGINADPLIVDHVADTENFGTVYFHEKATANIPSLSLLENTHSVNQVKSKKDMTVGYTATNRNTRQVFNFQQRARLFVHSATRLPKVSLSYVNTVERRKRMYTKAELAKADLAHLIRERLGWPSTATLKKIINTSSIRNMPITSIDVDRDLDVYGRSYADAAGKYTYKPTPNTPEEMVCDEASKHIDEMKKGELILHCDIIFCGGLAWLISVSRPLDYVICSLLHAKDWLHILRGIETHKNTYVKYGWKPKIIRFDNEKGVLAIKSALEKIDLHLENPAPHQHEPIVEAKNRCVKERMRCQIAHIDYKINRYMLAFLPKYVARRMNICPSNHNGVNVSPYEVLTGRRVDYKKELRIGFGELAHVYNRTQAPINSVKVKRVKQGICLGFCNNKETSAIFYDLSKDSGQIPTVADNFTCQPMSDDTIMRLNVIAEGMPKKLDLDYDDEDEPADEQNNSVEADATNIEDAEDIDPADYTPTSQDAEEELEKMDLNIDPSPLDDNFVDALDTPEDVNNSSDDVMELDETLDPLRGESVTVDADSGNADNAGSAGSVSETTTRRTRGSNGIFKKKNNSYSYAMTAEEQFNIMLYKHKVVNHISMKAGIKKYQADAYESILKEITAVEAKNVFVPLNPFDLTYQQKQKAIRSFIFMKEKFDAEGKFLKLKSRLTASGNQQDRIFVENSFGTVSSPTMAMSSLTTILAIAKSEKRHLATIDIGSAYLNADMSKENVIMILDSIVAGEYLKVRPDVKNMLTKKGELYVKLDKALYGSLQASKLWFDNISSFLTKLGFKANSNDPCVMNKWVGDDCITLGLYVDDILITATKKSLITKLRDALTLEYKEINYLDGNKITYLGMLIDNSNESYIELSMPQFIQDLLDERRIKPTDYSKTPASKHLFAIVENDTLLDDHEKESFHTSVAKLLYLSKRARPDVLLASTFLCTRVLNPGTDDLKKLNRCLRYLNATKDDIKYRINATDKLTDMCVYVDASFAVHPNMRSHSGAILTIGKNSVVFDESIKQKLNAKSSTEAELIAISDVLPQVIATKTFMAEQLQCDVNLHLYQDNKSTISLIKNGRPLAKSTRHINIRYFFVSDYVNRGELSVEHLGTDHMVADYFTKPLQGILFKRHRDFLMGIANNDIGNVLITTLDRVVKATVSD